MTGILKLIFWTGAAPNNNLFYHILSFEFAAGKTNTIIPPRYDYCRQICMETPNIWEHAYIHDGQKKKYKTQLINYNSDDYDPDNPSVYKNVQTELDKKLDDFLNAYHVNPLIPMRVDVSGKPFKISMGESESIMIEKLEEDKGLQGYGRL